MPVIESIREVPSVFIDMPKISGFENLDINKNIRLEIKGTVKSLSQNENGQSMRVEIAGVKIISKEKENDGLGRLKQSWNKAQKLAIAPSENRPIPAP